LSWWGEWDLKSQFPDGSVNVFDTMTTAGTGNGTTPEGVGLSGFAALSHYIPMGELEGTPHLYVGETVFGVFVKGFPTGVTPAASMDVSFQVASLGGEKSQFRATLGPVPGGWFADLKPFVPGSFIRPLEVTQNADYAPTNAPIAMAVTIVASACRSTVPSSQSTMEVTLVGGVPTVSRLTSVAPVQTILPYFKAPGLDVSRIPFSNTRTTAVAALFTNVTKALNKEGTVIAGRLNPMAVSPFDFSANTFATVAPCEKYYYGLENGFYTYAPLVSNSEEFAEDLFTRQHTGTFASHPVIHLANRGLVNAFAFSDPDGGTSLAINLDWHVEYRNSSVLWPVAISAVSLEVAHQTQIALLEAGFFFDNINHAVILSKLMQAVRYVAPAVKAAGRMVIRALPGVNTTVAAFKKEMAKGKPKRKRGDRPHKPRAEQRRPRPTVLNVEAKTAPRKMKSGLDLYLASKRS
jgi:hypothetical protein